MVAKPGIFSVAFPPLSSSHSHTISKTIQQLCHSYSSSDVHISVSVSFVEITLIKFRHLAALIVSALILSLPTCTSYSSMLLDRAIGSDFPLCLFITIPFCFIPRCQAFAVACISSTESTRTGTSSTLHEHLSSSFTNTNIPSTLVHENYK